MRGAAVGTIFARCSELVMVLIYMYFRENTVGFRMHDCLKFDREMLPSYTRHSLPVLGNELLWGVGFVATSVIIGRIGSVFVAANSIAGVLNQLVFISVSGVANAAAVLTGKTIGEGSRGRVQKVANTLLLFSVLVGVFNCLLVLVIRPLFLLLYNVTPETYEAAYTIIGVLACLQLVLGIDVTCIVGILRGGGDTRTAFVYDCGALWLVSIPMDFGGSCVASAGAAGICLSQAGQSHQGVPLAAAYSQRQMDPKCNGADVAHAAGRRSAARGGDGVRYRGIKYNSAPVL